jgi:hypothetical protein
MFFGETFDVSITIVRAAKNILVGHNGRSVGLRPEFCYPKDILGLGTTFPIPRFAIN